VQACNNTYGCSSNTTTQVLNEPPLIDDPMYGSQYSHTKMQSQLGWSSVGFGSNNVTIAIIDTGVDTTHQDLTRTVSGYSAFSGLSPNTDPHGHGTHCAGIAAATVNNAKGIVGVSPFSKIMPIKVLDSSGRGTTSTVAAGVTFAANVLDVKVLSMSLGGGGSSTLQNAINYALSKDKVIVAAMGNNGNSALSYPAAYNGIIAVGATDSNDTRASFSQYGNHISVTAPGVNILSTFPNNSYQNMSGTSMATPAVSGLAALIRSLKPSLTASEVKTKIQQNANDLGVAGFDPYYGYGRINLNNTLNNL
ncbi:MAG: S8 family serine peptidase, partial [Candidatus Sericytochromatia bacterium]